MLTRQCFADDISFFFFFLGAMEWCIPSIFEVFLKDTLDAAQNDAENLVVERLRKKDAEDF